MKTFISESTAEFIASSVVYFLVAVMFGMVPVIPEEHYVFAFIPLWIVGIITLFSIFFLSYSQDGLKQAFTFTFLAMLFALFSATFIVGVATHSLGVWYFVGIVGCTLAAFGTASMAVSGARKVIKALYFEEVL